MVIGFTYLTGSLGEQLKYLFILCAFLSLQVRADEPIFWSDTESELKSTVPAPAGLVQFILASEDAESRHQLRECVQENGLKMGQESLLFSVAEIPAASDTKKVLFVRPALKPYCFAFYGAHLFRYWFVASSQPAKNRKYEILFRGGGDGVGVLPTRTNGIADLVTYGHTAVSQFWVTLAFDGHEFKAKGCERRDFQEDGSLKSVPCPVN